jgi:hypothetical protein
MGLAFLVGSLFVLTPTKTYADTNRKIESGKAVVLTADEITDYVDKKGAEAVAQEVDVVTTATFGPMCSSGCVLNFGHATPRRSTSSRAISCRTASSRMAGGGRPSVSSARPFVSARDGCPHCAFGFAESSRMSADSDQAFPAPCAGRSLLPCGWTTACRGDERERRAPRGELPPGGGVVRLQRSVATTVRP